MGCWDEGERKEKKGKRDREEGRWRTSSAWAWTWEEISKIGGEQGQEWRGWVWLTRGKKWQPLLV